MSGGDYITTDISRQAPRAPKASLTSSFIGSKVVTRIHLSFSASTTVRSFAPGRSRRSRRPESPSGSPRRRRASEAVVDRLAQALVRNGHDGDAVCVRGIERPQMREQVCGGFDQVAPRGEIEHYRS